jgi:hypothetical protein
LKYFSFTKRADISCLDPLLEAIEMELVPIANLLFHLLVMSPSTFQFHNILTFNVAVHADYTLLGFGDYCLLFGLDHAQKFDDFLSSSLLMVLSPALALRHLPRKEALPDMVGHESEDEEKYHHKFSVENYEAKFPILAYPRLGIAHLEHAWVGQHSEAPRMTEQIDHVKKVDQRLKAFRASGPRDHKLVSQLFFIFDFYNSLIEGGNLTFRSIIVDG